jgi:hypothetical protein
LSLFPSSLVSFSFTCDIQPLFNESPPPLPLTITDESPLSRMTNTIRAHPFQIRGLV